MILRLDTRQVVVSIDSAYDDTPALTGPLASGSRTNDLRPTFSGKAIPGGTVTLYDGNAVLGTTVADSVTGKWSIEPASNMSENSHNLSATVTTATAGVSERTAPFILAIDAKAPDAPQIRKIDDDAGTKTGPVADGAPTDDETPTLSGIAEAGSVVKVIDDGKVLGTTVADALGNWVFTPTTPLNSGTHTITTTATDAAGNESKASQPATLLIDTTAPAAPTIDRVEDDQAPSKGQLASGSTTDDAQPVFSGKAEAGATVILMDGREVRAASCPTARATRCWTTRSP